MTDKSPQIPLVTQQPLSVDFAQNHLHSYHKAFESQYCYWDSDLKKFVPRRQHTSTADKEQSTDEDDVEEEQLISARRIMPAIAAMEFWKYILPHAMEKFMSERKDEPPKVKTRDCSIRGEAIDWEKIYGQLQKARETYDGGTKGYWGKFKQGTRKIFRKASEYTDVAQSALKLVPSHAIVSPVKAAVEVLLDAAKRAKEARKAVTKGVMAESLERTFGDIEILLATFREDENIREASIKLVMTILIAIEDAILFFLSHQLIRGATVIIKGENYAKPLLDEIEDIQKRGDDLMREAERSALVGNREAMEKIIRGAGQIVYLELQQSERIEFVIGKVATGLTKLDETYQLVAKSAEKLSNIEEFLAENQAACLNYAEKLFREGEARREETDKKNDEKADKRLRRLEEMIERLGFLRKRPIEEHKVQNEFYDQHQQEHTILPQHHPPPPPPYSWQYPMASGWWVPPPQGMQPYNPPWQPWIPSPLPAAMAPRQAPPSPHTITAAEIFGLLDMPIVDLEDIDSILETNNAMPINYRNHVAQVLQSPQFSRWATSPTSGELLVQADTASDDPTNSALALSFVCALSAKALRQRELSVCLVFFCERLDKFEIDQVGPVAMLRCLVAQLLDQQFKDASFLREAIDVDGIKAGDIEALCRLFDDLVRLLDRELTLVCLLDGVTTYESSEFREDLIRILEFIVELTRDDTLEPAVKVLATCPVGTVKVHNVLSDDNDFFLNMAGLPPVGHDLVMPDFETEFED